MTLPASGPISLLQIQNEFTTPPAASTKNLLNYRRAAGIVPDSPTNAHIPTTSPISLLQFHGAQGAFNFTHYITAMTPNFSNLTSYAVSLGWNYMQPINATFIVSPGVIVFSPNISTPAVRFDGTYPAGSAITLVVSAGAYVVGCGGNGGDGGVWGAGGNGTPGGPAIYVQNTGASNRIVNYGTIGSGGGGGGGGYGCTWGSGSYGGRYGGGGGGGAGVFGGSGGNIPNYYPGGSGYEGQSGSLTSGGAGGGAFFCGGPGGTGGNLGLAGATGSGAGIIRGTGYGGASGNSITGYAYLDGAHSALGVLYGPVM